MAIWPQPAGPLLAQFLDTVDRTPRNTVDFVTQLNTALGAQGDETTNPGNSLQGLASGTAAHVRALMAAEGGA